MGFVQRLYTQLRASGRRSNQLQKKAGLALERLEERIALAVDQYWVQTDLPPPVTPPTGSIVNPFRSIDGAQAAIRAKLAARPQARDIVVNIRGASYEIDTPIVFTGLDSGRNGRTVTWRAAPGETPIFTGSRQVTGWSQVTDPNLVGLSLLGNKLWKADVSSLSVVGRDQFRARQLYINGVRGTIAETMPSAMPEDLLPTYPYGFLPLIGQYNFSNSAIPVNGIAYSDPTTPANTNWLDWRDPTTWDTVENDAGYPDRQKDIEAVTRMQWREFRMPVESIGAYDPDQKVPVPGYGDVPVGLITMQADPWRAANLGVAPEQVPYEQAVWNPWRITQFTNSYRFLDVANEWYYDHVGQNVYLVTASMTDPNSLDVQIPVAESLLQVKGTAAAPVRNLAFQGITFSGATWLDPSFGSGYVADQAGVTVDTGRNPVTGQYLNDYNTTGHSKFTKATPGNVSVSFARNVTFRSNMFRNLGGVGLAVGKGSQGVRVIGNTFTSISSSAITVGGVSWARVDPSINPLQPQSKWVIDLGSRITAGGTDAFPNDPRAAVSDVAILQNTITGTGEDYVDASGILVGFARNTRIENNSISSTSWSGMQIGWGWGLVDSPRFPGQPNSVADYWLPYDLGRRTALSGTRNIGNVFTDFLRAVYDGAAIYTTGQQGGGFADGTLIQGNMLHGKRPLAGGNIIYTDGGTRWATVRDNLLYNNVRGEFWMGAAFSPSDALNVNLAAGPYYAFFPVVNGQPYGSEIGGAITAGNIRYEGNLWENRWPGTVFPFPLSNPGAPGYPNFSDWPNNPLFYAPPVQPYYGLTKGLTFKGNRFLVYSPSPAPGANPAITAWLGRHGYGTRWKPGAG